jgi:hypothetical protein
VEALWETHHHSALVCSDDLTADPKEGMKDDLSRRDSVGATRAAAAVAAVGLCFESVDSQETNEQGGMRVELNNSYLYPIVIEAVKHFAAENKPMAVLFHGLQVVIPAGICQGRRMTAFPTVGCDLQAAGAEYVDKGLDGVVVDGNLVTGATFLSHSKWLAEFLKLLGAEIAL